MTQEEREKAIQILVDRRRSNHSDTYWFNSRERHNATFHYGRYSDEALLNLILNPLDK